MENIRLRKSKTVKSEEASFLANRADKNISDLVTKQIVETIKISEKYDDECRNINIKGYEIARISHNMSAYFAAVSGTEIPKKENTENLCEYIDFLCKEALPYVQKRQIRIICKMPEEKVLAKFEKENFAYAFLNILLNSIEHSEPMSKIKVAFSKSKKFAKITITDKGEGMDEETLRRCAQPLFTGDRAGRKLGLGLTLAEHYFKTCGGRIKIHSEKGKGTSVSIFFPIGEEEKDFVAKNYEEIYEGGTFIPACITFSGLLEP